MINEYSNYNPYNNQKTKDEFKNYKNQYIVKNEKNLEHRVQECIERSLEQIDVLQQLRARSIEKKSSQKYYYNGKSTSRTNEYQHQMESNLKQCNNIQLFVTDENKENHSLNYQKQKNNRIELEDINFDKKQDELEKLFVQTIQRSRQITKNFIFLD